MIICWKYEKYLGEMNLQTLLVAVWNGILFALFSLCLLNFMLKRQFFITGIKATNLDLIVSAFMDL